MRADSRIARQPWRSWRSTGVRPGARERVGERQRGTTGGSASRQRVGLEPRHRGRLGARRERAAERAAAVDARAVRAEARAVVVADERPTSTSRPVSSRTSRRSAASPALAGQRRSRPAAPSRAARGARESSDALSPRIDHGLDDPTRRPPRALDEPPPRGAEPAQGERAPRAGGARRPAHAARSLDDLVERVLDDAARAGLARAAGAARAPGALSTTVLTATQRSSASAEIVGVPSAGSTSTTRRGLRGGTFIIRPTRGRR